MNLLLKEIIQRFYATDMVLAVQLDPQQLIRDLIAALEEIDRRLTVLERK
jgi:hypothetical protein